MPNSLDIPSIKSKIISIAKNLLRERFSINHIVLIDKFVAQYEDSIKAHEIEDNSDILKFYRLTSQYKPVLASVLPSPKDAVIIGNLIDEQFDATLHQEREQPKQIVQQPVAKLEYYCSICHQSFKIPPEDRRKIEETEETIVLPMHCGKAMSVKIMRTGLKSLNTPPISTNLKADNPQHYQRDINQLKVLSVGIDVGSSTSHLVFSRLTLKREFSYTNKTNQFQIVDRELVYVGDIIFTPLLDVNTIDIEALIEFFKKEYKKAGLTPEMVDTGAVIVTGETAKKDNAALIVNQLSSSSGKFVSASAGANFESMLGIMGSGMVEESKKLQQTIMNVDIGGGTSNIAIAYNGTVVSTSCINVGGRLLGIDENFKIWRIDQPTARVMKELGLDYSLGDIIPEEDVLKITGAYAHALFEVMQGPAISPIAKMLLMTDDIKIDRKVEKYSFTGGVAEMIYTTINDPNNNNPYNDIGKILADEIKRLVEDQHLELIEPKSKIRATVIGAGAFSLSVSGSTCYWDESVQLPLENIPIVPINPDYTKFFFDGYKKYMKTQIDLALKNFSLVEGEDNFALYFKDYVNKSALISFTQSLEYALTKSIENDKLILIILGEDGGKVLGLTIKHETSIKKNLLCLDELKLEAGDWIDIGAPLDSGEKKAFPITKKSLVFPS